MLFLVFSLSIMFSCITAVSAVEPDNTWLSKKYERLHMFEFPNVATSEFDNKNFKTTYSELVQATGSPYKVVFNADSISYYTYRENYEGAEEKANIYARIDDTKDYLSVHYDFSKVDVIRIVYYAGHNSKDCSNDTHAMSNAKTLDIHILDSFKSSGSTELIFPYSFFPEVVCVENVHLFTESEKGTIDMSKTGEIYNKDALNRYEFYSNDIFNVGSGGSPDNSSSISDSSSSTGGSVTPPIGSDVEEALNFSLFDGSIDTAVPESTGTKTFKDMITVEWAGISGGGSSIDTFVDNRSYNLCWRSGGKSNDTRYIKFNVSEKAKYFQIYVVIAPNGSSKADISVGGQTLFNTGSDKNVYSYAYSEPLPSGNYELRFTNSVRFANISFFLTEEPDTPIDTEVPDYKVVNTVFFTWVDDNGIQRYDIISDREYQAYTELPIPADVTTGQFIGWYEDNGTFENQFTFDEFKEYYSGITEETSKGAIAIYAKILDKNENRNNDDVVLEKVPSEGDKPGDGEGQTLCHHEIDWLKFACRKCGMSVFEIVWNAIKYWVFGILGVIAAAFMIKWAINLAKG